MLDRLGVLYHNQHRLPFIQAVRHAITFFQQYPHTQGYHPDQIRVNPKDLPNVKAIDGVPVEADDTVKSEHIRVVTAPVDNELV